MSQGPDIAAGASETIVQETHDTPPPPTEGTGLPSSLHKAHEKISKESIILERPGRSKGSWERWLFTPGLEPELLPQEMTLPKRCKRHLCLPSSALFSWPLWVASDGENLDLVRLELSGRHLLKRGMEESLGILPILHQEERQLLLAVAPEEPFPAEIMPPHWKNADRFELPSRLHAGALTHDLILWEEWEGIQMAFYRNQNPVWFCGARPQGLAGLIHRISLRLLAEGVLEKLPANILFDGLSEEITASCRVSLSGIFPQARITLSDAREKDSLPPQLREPSLDLPPTEARMERQRAKQRQKLFSVAIVGVILYLLLLLWGAGDLLIRQTALKRLRGEIAKVEQPAQDAQQQSSRWHLFRPLIDPNTYALDLLAAAAAPMDGGKVRLTLFSLEQGHLHLSGEASDVTQAYSVMEQLKKNPLLQEYDWSSGQPQLAGKNSVKFDMEGTRPDAPKEETPQQTGTP